MSQKMQTTREIQYTGNIRLSRKNKLALNMLVHVDSKLQQQCDTYQSIVRVVEHSSATKHNSVVVDNSIEKQSAPANTHASILKANQNKAMGCDHQIRLRYSVWQKTQKWARILIEETVMDMSSFECAPTIESHSHFSLSWSMYISLLRDARLLAPAPRCPCFFEGHL